MRITAQQIEDITQAVWGIMREYGVPLDLRNNPNGEYRTLRDLLVRKLENLGYKIPKRLGTGFWFPIGVGMPDPSTLHDEAEEGHKRGFVG